MKLKFALLSGILSILLFVTSGFSQEVLDAVVAIVGDKIILRSEVAQKVETAAMQQNIAPSSKLYEQLKDQVLEELISQKILLIQAKIDTITIDDKRVDAELDNRMNTFIEQAGSKEKVEESFGLPFNQLKRKFRPELKDYMLVQQVRETKIRDIKIYPQEVELFYNSMKDSLPIKPAMVKMSHILIGIKAGGEAYNQTLAKMKDIQKQLAEGKTFEELAMKYSEDTGTAGNGGKLGFIARGEIFLEFEDAAFRLQEQEVSEIVQTDVGLHLIKCLEKRGDRVSVAHIFLKITESQDDEQAALDLANDLRNQIIAGAPFDSLAVLYSDDPNAAETGGSIPWTQLEQLAIPAFIENVKKLDIGEVSEPFKTQFGYHLVVKEGEQKARPFSLEEDYEQLKMAALQQKQNTKFVEYIDELKKGLHIDIKRDLLK